MQDTRGLVTAERAFNTNVHDGKALPRRRHRSAAWASRHSRAHTSQTTAGYSTRHR